MNPLYIIGGLVYVTIGIWTFDWMGKKEKYDSLFDMYISLFDCLFVWWLFLYAYGFIEIKVDIKVPERYRVRKKWQ